MKRPKQPNFACKRVLIKWRGASSSHPWAGTTDASRRHCQELSSFLFDFSLSSALREFLLQNAIGFAEKAREKKAFRILAEPDAKERFSLPWISCDAERSNSRPLKPVDSCKRFTTWGAHTRRPVLKRDGSNRIRISLRTLQTHSTRLMPNGHALRSLASARSPLLTNWLNWWGGFKNRTNFRWTIEHDWFKEWNVREKDFYYLALHRMIISPCRGERDSRVHLTKLAASWKNFVNWLDRRTLSLQALH